MSKLLSECGGEERVTRARCEINSQGRNVWLLTEKERRRRSRQKTSLKKERGGKI